MVAYSNQSKGLTIDRVKLKTAGILVDPHGHGAELTWFWLAVEIQSCALLCVFMWIGVCSGFSSLQVIGLFILCALTPLGITDAITSHSK